MVTGHTPGPWQDDNTRKHYAKRVIRHNGVIVAELGRPSAGLTVDEAEANARLIAAAPALLEWLLTALPYVEDHETDPGYKPGVVKRQAREIKALLERVIG